MEIAFILDGVPDFRNLTGTPLEEYSQLDVYHNPVFTGFGTSSNTLTFTSTWPVEDKYLEIKVKHAHMTRVYIIIITKGDIKLASSISASS